MRNERCHLLAIDFDKGSWADDVGAFAETCRAVGIPAAVERSRSGNGAHAWFFFDEPVPAVVARRLGCYLLTETMSRRPELGMDSYDRLFPNQDTMPRGGFGNLIALPLQREARERGNTVFVDDALRPHPDQWAFLAGVPRIPAATAELVAREAQRQGRVLGVRFAAVDEDEAPWTRSPSRRLPRRGHARGRLRNHPKRPVRIRRRSSASRPRGNGGLTCFVRLRCQRQAIRGSRRAGLPGSDTVRDERARQRRAQRKKRKREERRRALRGAVAELIPVREDCRVFATDGRAEPLPPGVETWPVIRAYVPARNVWEATGLGTAGVVRQQPDGRFASAFFIIELLEHGLRGAFGGRDETLTKLEEDLVLLSDNFPLCEEGPVELAASFAWGARALADAEGYPFPAQDADRFYGLMPRPPGSDRDWVARLVGPGGLTPQELIRAIRANPQPDDLPDGKEIMILTEMTFEISDAGAAVDALRRAVAEFQHEGREGSADVFSWTRPYPKGHWSPLSSPGGRQILGGVRVSGREIVADAKTLSMAAKLVGKLQRLLDGGLHLQGSRWIGVKDLMARGRGASEVRALDGS